MEPLKENYWHEKGFLYRFFFILKAFRLVSQKFRELAKVNQCHVLGHQVVSYEGYSATG